MTMPSIKENGSPSMSMRSAKVPLSPSSALQAMNLRSEAVSSTVCHLIPVGKPGAATAPQSRVGHFGHDLLRRHLKRAAQSAQAACRLVVGDRERVVYPDAGEGETRLALEMRDLLGLAQKEPAGRAVEHARSR